MLDLDLGNPSPNHGFATKVLSDNAGPIIGLFWDYVSGYHLLGKHSRGGLVPSPPTCEVTVWHRMLDKKFVWLDPAGLFLCSYDEKIGTMYVNSKFLGRRAGLKYSKQSNP